MRVFTLRSRRRSLVRRVLRFCAPRWRSDISLACVCPCARAVRERRPSPPRSAVELEGRLINDVPIDVPPPGSRRTGGAPAPNVQEAGTGVSNLYGLDWPACEGSAARPELPISPRSSRCGMGSSAAPVREETASTARLDGGAALGAGAEDGRMTALLATSPVQPPHNLRNQVYDVTAPVRQDSLTPNI